MDRVTMTVGQFLILVCNGYGISQAELAKLMKRPEQMVSELKHGKKRVTGATALDLEDATGVPARVWLLLQNEADLAARTASRG